MTTLCKTIDVSLPPTISDVTMETESSHHIGENLPPSYETANVYERLDGIDKKMDDMHLLIMQLARSSSQLISEQPKTLTEVVKPSGLEEL